MKKRQPQLAAWVVSEANGSAYNTRGQDKSFQIENAAAATSRSGSEKKNTADSKNMTVNKMDCEKAAAATRRSRARIESEANDHRKNLNN